MKFGDPIENTSASKDNPEKYSFYVRTVFKTGRMNPGKWIECTDKKGKFWLTDAEAIVKREVPNEK